MAWDHRSFLRWVTSPIVHPSILCCLLKTALWIWHRSTKQSYTSRGTMLWRTYGATSASLPNSSDFQFPRWCLLWELYEDGTDGSRPALNSVVYCTCSKALSKSSLLNTPPYLGDIVCTGRSWFRQHQLHFWFDKVDACITSMTKSYIGSNPQRS